MTNGGAKLTMRALWHIARADFLERFRRYSRIIVYVTGGAYLTRAGWMILG